MTEGPFTPRFVVAVRTLIQQHHILYPAIAPFGTLFESLVDRAFRATELPPSDVARTTPNLPREDILVSGGRISIKTETGVGTKQGLISITKLCTTERDPWEAGTLIQRALNHLRQYEHILMLRATWPPNARIHYQLVDIPIELLRRMELVILEPVGNRPTRRSLAGAVFEGQERLFRIRFDGTDGKCQIQELRTDRCRILEEWDHYIT